MLDQLADIANIIPVSEGSRVGSYIFATISMTIERIP